MTIKQLDDFLTYLPLPFPQIVWAGFLALLLSGLVLFRKRSNVPPGPPGDPIIGHVRIMPSEYPWKTFSEWGKKYGDVVFVHAFGRPMIIVNSYLAAREIMDKKGANFSHRPQMVFFDMMGWDEIMAFLPYGDRFKRQRRLMQKYFTQQAVTDYHPIQIKRTYTLLMDLLESPEDFISHVHRALSSTLVMATYGHEVKDKSDKFIRLVEEATTLTVSYGPPGGVLVDFLPILRHIPSWMPGAGFKRHALKTRKAVQETINVPYEMVKKAKENGNANPCLTLSLLEDKESKNPEIEDDIKYIGGNTYGAGVETTEAFLLTFLLTMTLYPSFAKKAQQEIDVCIGKTRLPTLEDRKNLPYIDCIMRESCRWNPPVPLGIPHASIEEDTYRDWTIPAEATIIPNIWQMMHDEEHFPDPHTSNPDRFLNFGTIQSEPQSHETSADETRDGGQDWSNNGGDPLSVIFGFGRRFCPGRSFAESGIWLTIACVLAVFDIQPEVGPQTGDPIYPPKEFATGTSSPPKPFKCRITPRGDYVKDLIATERVHV